MSSPLIDEITFTNREGRKLRARLEFPADGHTRAFALFAHCFACSIDPRVVRNISLSLTNEGIGVMVFDFTGLEAGVEDPDTYSSKIEDLVDAAGFLRDNYKAPTILLGHSMGGTAALCAASRIKEIQAIATLGAPFDPGHVFKLITEDPETVRREGSGEVHLQEKRFKVGAKLVEELENEKVHEHIRNMKAALLVLHSPQDQVVDIENARLIYDTAMHPKSFISLDGADHMMSETRDTSYAGHVIAAWASRYVEFEKQDIRTDQQVAVVTGKEKYTTRVRAGEHYLIGDEPLNKGGKDLGPTPYGFLLAALGSCTSITLRMYADRKEWDLREIRVHLSHTKVHADDSARNKTIDRIARKIELDGNLTSEQRARLLDIADRCPVHRTLHNHIEVQTSLVE